ncbi:MAG: hypothetical protein NTW86_25605, partial [Candidatus Sumerlaeota bacterium]|nr:hypothetical protein [Candidatus Sumerlaeota bacterium]
MAFAFADRWTRLGGPRARCSIALAALLVSSYSLVYIGDVLGAYDEIVRYLMTDNLFHGRGFRSEYLDAKGQWQRYGEDVVPRYGFLHPLLALPLRAAAALIPSNAFSRGVLEFDKTLVGRVPLFCVLW